MSHRRGDSRMTLGRHLAIGIGDADAREVGLLIVESLTFRVLEPGAAIVIAG